MPYDQAKQQLEAEDRAEAAALPPLCSICSEPYPEHASPASSLKLCGKCWDVQALESQRVKWARLMELIKGMRRAG